MKRFFQQNGGILLLIALLLSILISLFAAFNGRIADPLSSAISSVLTPFQTASASALRWMDDVSDYLFNFDEIQDELQEKTLKIAELEGELRAAEDANRENEQLRALLGLKEKRQDFELESARVAARKNSNWSDSLTISKGSLDGIEAGDCVIDEAGNLLGVVDVVAPTSASVYTVVDAQISLGGMVARTYETGILEGVFSLSQQGLLKLGYLAEDARFAVGDTVLTSGLGDEYPSGLVVGTVTEVCHEPSGMSRYALIAPTITLDNLLEVFVIKDFAVEE